MALWRSYCLHGIITHAPPSLVSARSKLDTVAMFSILIFFYCPIHFLTFLSFHCNFCLLPLLGDINIMAGWGMII